MDTSKEKHYNYFYIIVNKVNRKFYYGVHSTDNLDDGYMGSGDNIKKAIKKYGIENFVKTILGFFDTRAELMEVEREFINPKFLEEHRDTCYNCKPGGDGGVTPEIAEKISEAMMGKNKGKTQTEEHRRKNSESHKGKPSPFKGRRHSPETIEKMKRNHKGMKGRKHSPESIEKMRESARRRWANKKK